MINVGIVGCGYWGPNLIRNFMSCPETELLWACDKDEKRLKKAMRQYSGVSLTVDVDDLVADESLDAVAIATPVETHFRIAKACLENGKHILIEKPFTLSLLQGNKLVQLAREKDLQIMCDQTFCYTSAVRKMQEIVQSGVLGKLLYFDSVRINLGLFQQDINVIWDLAPHDLSILDLLIDDKIVSVSAHGLSHAGNNIENIAYLALKYENNFIAHLHVNWLSPVKIRRIILGGSEKMVVWDDMNVTEKIKVYNKGIVVEQDDQEKVRQFLISYRSGDIYSPHIDNTEALALVVKEFAACIEENRPALTDGKAGLRILQVLESAQKSVKTDGSNVPIQDVMEI